LAIFKSLSLVPLPSSPEGCGTAADDGDDGGGDEDDDDDGSMMMVVVMVVVTHLALCEATKRWRHCV